MKLKNKKSGFTLLEIIIVIIIVGVLASLALPRLFSTIEYSRSTEALSYLGQLKRGWVTCATTFADGADPTPAHFLSCDTTNQMGYESTGAHYSYTATAPAPGDANSVVLTATRRANNGAAGGDIISVSHNLVTLEDGRKCGDGAFSAIGDCTAVPFQ